MFCWQIAFKSKQSSAAWQGPWLRGYLTLTVGCGVVGLGVVVVVVVVGIVVVVT